MSVRSLSPFLFTEEYLEVLIKLLLEKETLRRSIRVRGFGPRVKDLEQAQRLFDRVVQCTQRVLHLNASQRNVPKLVLTEQLSQLPRQTLKSYLLFLPVALVLLFLGLQQSLTGAMLYILFGMILFLLLIPLLLHRRTRIHVEHRCGYGTDEKGEGVIVIDQLPSIQFQSYLAHECAHHIYVLQREDKMTWMKEGWARLVQWQVANDLYHLEGDPAYLYHVLVQIIGELKFACEMTASALQKRLPFKVRRTRSIYHRNPLFTLLTGTPASKTIPLMDHAIGTASYFLAAERRGIEAALHEDISRLLQKGKGVTS